MFPFTLSRNLSSGQFFPHWLVLPWASTSFQHGNVWDAWQLICTHPSQRCFASIEAIHLLRITVSSFNYFSREYFFDHSSLKTFYPFQLSLCSEWAHIASAALRLLVKIIFRWWYLWCRLVHYVSFNLYTKSVKFHNHMPKYQFAYNVNSTSFIFVIYQILLFWRQEKNHFLEKIVHWNSKVYRLPPGRNILFVYVQ